MWWYANVLVWMWWYANVLVWMCHTTKLVAQGSYSNTLPLCLLLPLTLTLLPYSDLNPVPHPSGLHYKTAHSLHLDWGEGHAHTFRVRVRVRVRVRGEGHAHTF